MCIYIYRDSYLGDCQNYGPFLGPYYNTGPNTGPNLGDPKRDHNFDNPPFMYLFIRSTRVTASCQVANRTGDPADLRLPFLVDFPPVP